MPWPEPTQQVPLPRPRRTGREHLALSIPRPEQVPLDQLGQLVPNLVGGRGRELLRIVERRRLLALDHFGHCPALRRYRRVPVTAPRVMTLSDIPAQ